MGYWAFLILFPLVVLSPGLRAERANHSQFQPRDYTKAMFVRVRHPHLKSSAGADLRGFYCVHSKFTGFDFTGSDMSGARIFNCNFKNAKLTQTDLSAADLSFSDFSGADLKGTNLAEAFTLGTTWKNATFDQKTNLPFSRSDALAKGMKEVTP